jgi:hypothetical protein
LSGKGVWNARMRHKATRSLREQLAENVLSVKDRRGQTYARLAKGARLPATTFQRVAVAQNACTVDVLEEIAAHFGVLPWALLVPDFNPADPFVQALRASDVRELEGLREKAAAWDELQKLVRSMPAGDRGVDGLGDGAGEDSPAPAAGRGRNSV